MSGVSMRPIRKLENRIFATRLNNIFMHACIRYQRLSVAKRIVTLSRLLEINLLHTRWNEHWSWPARRRARVSTASRPTVEGPCGAGRIQCAAIRLLQVHAHARVRGGAAVTTRAGSSRCPLPLETADESLASLGGLSRT